jgi:hypothetical protein
MAKQVMLSDAVIKKLDILKNERDESYSKIIDACLKSSYNIDLDLINEHFKELKRLIPRLDHSTELIRVVWIRFYRLSSSKQEMTAKEIDSLTEIVSKEAINLIGEIK